MKTYVKVSVGAVNRGRASNRRYRYHVAIFVNNILIEEIPGRNYQHLNYESAVKEGLDRVVGAADKNGYAVLIVTVDQPEGRLYVPRTVKDETLPDNPDEYKPYNHKV